MVPLPCISSLTEYHKPPFKDTGMPLPCISSLTEYHKPPFKDTGMSEKVITGDKNIAFERIVISLVPRGFGKHLIKINRIKAWNYGI